MNGGSVPAFMPAATSRAADCRVTVLFSVRPGAVAVLEIEAIVLDRLALELLDDARAHGVREPGMSAGSPMILRERLCAFGA